jgi:hypothetical protein
MRADESTIRSVFDDESLRFATRRAAREHAGGVAGLAAALRISVRTLLRFLRGARPGRVTAGVLDARLRGGRGREPHAAGLGIALIVAELPAPLRAAVREAVGWEMARVLTLYGQPVPEWLDEELRQP